MYGKISVKNMFIVGLFEIAVDWKKPTCFSIEDWCLMNWCIHVMECSFKRMRYI